MGLIITTKEILFSGAHVIVTHCTAELQILASPGCADHADVCAAAAEFRIEKNATRTDSSLKAKFLAEGKLLNRNCN